MQSNEYRFEFSGIFLLLTSAGDGLWRIQTSRNNNFDSRGAAQIISEDAGEKRNFPVLPLEITTMGNESKVTAHDGSFAVITGKEISFFDSDGNFRRSVTRISEGEDEETVALNLTEKEKIYGTGERFDRVNQRGKRIHIYAIDKWCHTRGNSYVPVPLLISSEGTGIYMNRYEHSFADIGHSDRSTIKISQKYAPVDLYIIIGRDIADVIKKYSSVTGFAPMPAPWSFGTIVCRYHPDFGSAKGVSDMMKAMEENDFPWEAIITEGFKQYNPEKKTEFAEICNMVHASGKKLLVYEQCGRFPNEYADYYNLTDEDAVQSHEGVYLKETRSMNFLDNFHHKAMRCIDLTRPESIEKWKGIWQEFIDMGVDGAKIDFCEQFPDKKIIEFADGRNPMPAHHWYPTRYNIMMNELFRSGPDGGMNFARGGGIGAQRYPFIWAGDQRREFFFLKAVLRAALSCGLSGIPFVSWDMAGYQPAWNPYDRKHEADVFMRGIEMTAFSPCIQTHGRVTRPYDFDEHTKDVYRAYTKLHDALRPYLLEQAEKAASDGIPLMRHLCLFDSGDEKCLDCEDEYMLGCGLLIAPVLNRKKKRNIYLPKGSWVNIFTGEEFPGRQTLRNYSVPEEAIPVFLLKNSETARLKESLSAGKCFISDIVNLIG